MFAGILAMALMGQPQPPPDRRGAVWAAPAMHPVYSAWVYNNEPRDADAMSRPLGSVTPNDLLRIVGPGVTVPRRGSGRSNRGHR